MDFHYLKQLPVLPPSAYASNDVDFIVPRMLELVYTAYDLKPFAEDIGYHGEPFRWDEERRALLRAELDAYYARLYGLTRDELRYILDPQDVYGPDFPGETFRVLKDKEIRLYGEYRTRRLVLEAWDRLEGSSEQLSVSSEPGIGERGEGIRASEQLSVIGEREPDRKVTEGGVKATAKPEAEPARAEEEVPAPEVEKPSQPALIDFSVYRCEVCDKMVMGYDRENHVREVHGGKVVEWRRVK
jgi:hypothetical protein